MHMKNRLITLVASLGLLSMVVADVVPGAHQVSFTRGTRQRNTSTNVTTSDAVGDANAVIGRVQNEVNWYGLEVEVGTPPQKLILDIDTGSADFWVIATEGAFFCSPKNCTASGLYDQFKSSSYQFVSPFFSALYADSSGALGHWIKEDVKIGGLTLNHLTIGLGLLSTVGHGVIGLAPESCIAGIGSLEIGTYHNYPTALVDAGLAESRAYSLYLNSTKATEGTLIFGGVDSNAYIGNLTTHPVYGEGIGILSVFLNSVSLNGVEFPLLQPAVLDSGTTITYLPDYIVDPIVLAIGGIPFIINIIECIPETDTRTIDFKFGCATIKVKLSDFQTRFPLDQSKILGSPNKCIFGLASNVKNAGINILGDSFLRAAYVVYDLDNAQISLAQANQSALAIDSQIKIIPKEENGVPGAQLCPPVF